MESEKITESQIQAETRLAAGLIPGVRLFRNNCGRLMNPKGRWVEFGLGVGSSDLIGFRAITITPSMVGEKIAQFVAIECKTATGRVTEHQERFINLVNAFGGKAVVVRSADEVRDLIRHPS